MLINRGNTMMRKFLCASVATALLAGSISPAMAQSFSSDLQAPLGATATVNFTVPLGAAPTKEKKPTYGLTLGYGRQLDSLTTDGRIMVRQAKLADIRFADGFKLQRAKVMSFDLANLDKDRRLNMGPDAGSKDTTWLWIGGIAVGAALVYFLVIDDDDDDDDDLD